MITRLLTALFISTTCLNATADIKNHATMTIYRGATQIGSGTSKVEILLRAANVGDEAVFNLFWQDSSGDYVEFIIQYQSSRANRHTYHQVGQIKMGKFELISKPKPLIYEFVNQPGGSLDLFSEEHGYLGRFKL